VNWDPGYGEGPYIFLDGLWVPAALSEGASESVRGRNAILNADFRVWSALAELVVGAADGAYVATLYRYHKSGAMVHTLSRSDDVPSLAQARRLIPYSLLIDCTTADVAIGASDYCLLRFPVEGYNWKRFAQRACIFWFFVKATKTGVYSVALRNATTDACFVSEYTVDQADVWELKSILIPASPAAGAWNYTTGVGLEIVWTVAAGSDYHGPAGAWVSGNYLSTANQVNGCDSAGNDFRIASPVFEAGDYARAFEAKSFQQELYETERYYIDRRFPETGSSLGYTTSVTNGSNYHISVAFPQRMRATPTMSWQEWTSTAFPATAANFQSVGPGGFNVFKQANATSGQGYFLGGFVADARL
jgi:hypothetical protein